MFSLKEGAPFAMIKGGKYNGEFVGIVTDGSKGYDEVKVTDGKLFPIVGIPGTQRKCVYVTGPSGSGKSTFVAQLAGVYKNLNKKNPVILFSRIGEDESIDQINPTRVTISEDLLSNPIQPSELENSMTIFDDTDTIRDKKVLNEIINLQNDLLETGRHQDINLVIVSHLMSDYKKSRIVLNESDLIVFFPKSGSLNQINTVLKKHVGCTQKQIDNMMKLPSRWVAVHNKYPRYVMYETGAYLL